MPSSPSYNWNPISLWFLPPICEPLPQPNVTWDFPRRVNFFLHNSAIQHLKGHFSPPWFPICPNLFEMFGLYFGKLCEDLVLDVWECRLYFLWLVMNSYLTSIRHLQIENFHLLRACPNFQPRCSFRGKSVWRRGRYSNVASFWTLIVSLRNISIPNRQNTLIWIKDKKFKGNQKRLPLLIWGVCIQIWNWPCRLRWCTSFRKGQRLWRLHLGFCRCVEFLFKALLLLCLWFFAAQFRLKHPFLTPCCSQEYLWIDFQLELQNLSSHICAVFRWPAEKS